MSSPRLVFPHIFGHFLTQIWFWRLLLHTPTEILKMLRHWLIKTGKFERCRERDSSESMKFRRCRDRDSSKPENFGVCQDWDSMRLWFLVEVETDSHRDWPKDVEIETFSRDSLLYGTLPTISNAILHPFF